MYIREVPKKFQKKQPDIILRINAYENKHGQRTIVPVDLYTFYKSIEILNAAIVNAVLEVDEFQEIYKAINSDKKEEIKNKLSKAILGEMYVAKVNEGCWIMYIFFGLVLPSVVTTILGKIAYDLIKPSLTGIGQRFYDNKIEPELDKREILIKTKDNVPKIPKPKGLNIHGHIKDSDESTHLELNAYFDRENRPIIQTTDVEFYEKLFED